MRSWGPGGTRIFRLFTMSSNLIFHEKKDAHGELFLDRICTKIIKLQIIQQRMQLTGFQSPGPKFPDWCGTLGIIILAIYVSRVCIRVRESYRASYTANWGFWSCLDHPQHPWFDQRGASIFFPCIGRVGNNSLMPRACPVMANTQRKQTWFTSLANKSRRVVLRYNLHQEFENI